MRLLKPLALFLALLLFLQPTLLLAQPSTRFPDSTTIIQDNIRYEGFDLTGFRELLKIDLDLQIALQQLELETQRAEQIQIQLDATTRYSLLLDNNLQIMTSERDRIYERWEEQNRELHECENRPRVYSVVGWVLAATLGVALGGTIIGVRLGRR